MLDEALYRYVFNAQFWKSIGFRNKRASAHVELKERIYMEDHLKSLVPVINGTRSIVGKYIKHYYRDEIESLNEEDELRSWTILQDRVNEKEEQIRRRSSNTLFIPHEDSAYSRVTLDSIVSTTPTSETHHNYHFISIMEICSKYKDDPCSKEVVDYLRFNGLV